MEEKKIKEPTTSWKGCIIWGVVNILLVLLCTSLGKIMLSSAMILLIIFGFAISFQFVKEDWKS